MADAIDVELLHTPGCGGWATARDRLIAVAERAGIAIALTTTIVDSTEEALRRRLPGSPTVRVDGEDVVAGPAEDFGLG